MVEMSDGEGVLQGADGEGAPLVLIAFSSEARAYMNGAIVDIAKAMIEAGIESAAELFDTRVEAEFEAEKPVPPRHLHGKQAGRAALVRRRRAAPLVRAARSAPAPNDDPVAPPLRGGRLQPGHFPLGHG